MEQLENAPLCTFLPAQQQGHLTGRASQPSHGGGGVSHLPPSCAKGKTPHRTCNEHGKAKEI